MAKEYIRPKSEQIRIETSDIIASSVDTETTADTTDAYTEPDTTASYTGGGSGSGYETPERH